MRHAYGLSDTGDADAYARMLAMLAGAVPGFTPSPLFDPAWVRGQVSATGSVFGLLEQYSAGWERSGISPNPFFPPGLYAAAAGAAAWQRGALAGFIASGCPGAAVMFDDAGYARTLGTAAPVLAGMGLTPFIHYVAYGWREGRPANPLFDEAWYLGRYPAVADAVAAGRYPNGYSHFILLGEAEGRQPNPFFDPAAYLRANVEVAAAMRAGRVWSAFRHLWDHGRFEGWRTRDQPTPATPSLFAFVRDDFPRGGDRDALLAAGVAFAATGAIPEELREAGRRAFRRATTPVVAIDAPALPVLAPDEPPRRMFISGIAVLPGRALTDIVVDAATGLAARVVRVIRVTAPEYLEEDPFGLAMHGELRPGFLAELEVAAAAGTGAFTLALRFLFGECQTVRSIGLRVAAPPAVASPLGVDAEVCLASYAPPARQFAGQTGSILRQDGATTRLLISDDASPAAGSAGLQAVTTALRQAGEAQRVVLSVAEANEGFAGNFERAMRMAPGDARAVMLADQDDVWHPVKARTLLDALADPAVSCAFSDMRVVDEDGQVMSDTFWRQRAVHHRHPVALAVANAVTGAAVALPGRLLGQLLPVPRYPGLYHDMWLSVACAALGRIAYVDRPLYDYVQHGENVLGFWKSRRDCDERWRSAWRALRGMARTSPAEWTERQCEFWLMAGAQARGPLAQRWVLLSEALRRFPAWHDPQARTDAATLAAVLTGEASAAEVAAAWRRVHRQGGGDGALLGIDQLLACALAAVRIAAMADPGPAAARIARHLWARKQALAEAEPAGRTAYEQWLGPVEVRQTASAATGFVMLMPELQPPPLLVELRVHSFFSDLYTRLTVMERLVRAGCDVRLLLLDEKWAEYGQAARIAAIFPEFGRALDRVELIAAGNRGRGMAPVAIGDRDMLIATDWRSAHAAHGMAQASGRTGFLYLIQDHEPDVLPAGAARRLAEQSYRLPHHALFAGEALAGFFRASGLGVFSAPGGAFLQFEPPLLGGVVRAAAGRPVLLFHAGPEPDRVLYEIGLAALRLAAEALGDAAAQWQFIAIGITAPDRIVLSPHATLRLARRLDLTTFRQLLAQARVGLALTGTAAENAIARELTLARVATVTNRPGEPTDPATIAQAVLSAMRSVPDTQHRSLPAGPATPPDLAGRIIRLGEATLPRPRRSRRRA